VRGILASACFHIRASLLEGVNNRIKLLAYGSRDSDNFFLKIKAAFPRQSAMNQFFLVSYEVVDAIYSAGYLDYLRIAV
jgi:hypothetical protein